MLKEHWSGQSGEQDKEILAESIKVIGLCDPEEYPIQPKPFF